MIPLTIPILDEPLAMKLRQWATSHGRTVEAEAQALLRLAVDAVEPETNQASPAGTTGNICDPVRGIWRGRITTDEMMRELRGDD